MDLSKVNKEEKQRLFSKALSSIEKIIPKSQIESLNQIFRGEESMFALETVIKLSDTFQTMHKTCEQDGMGKKAIAHLHYFTGGMDWYITEKDMGDEQIQAFGSANLGHGAELGYINLEELAANNVEIDFHFDPVPLGVALGEVSHDDSIYQKSPGIN